jgi:hypothetical protein
VRSEAKVLIADALATLDWSKDSFETPADGTGAAEEDCERVASPLAKSQAL